MSENDPVSVLVLASRGIEQYALINSLAGQCEIKGIVLESRTRVLARVFLNRLKRHGPWVVADQLAFKILDLLIFQPNAVSRSAEILGCDTAFDAEAFGSPEIIVTNSVNSERVLSLARAVKTDLVVVSGVSILGDELLDVLDGVPVINIHCGITPRYRGAHGAFWAVVSGDWENIGVTVHFIDRGVDTGAIIFQENIQVEPDDDPRTLALKQNAAGIRLVGRAISKIRSRNIEVIERSDLDSRVYSSPTLSAYFVYRNRMKEHFSF
jgi:folate-dependent phosphoribosylglycinamide formyltransferase PurN